MIVGRQALAEGAGHMTPPGGPTLFAQDSRGSSVLTSDGQGSSLDPTQLPYLWLHEKRSARL